MVLGHNASKGNRNLDRNAIWYWPQLLSAKVS